MLFLIGIQVFMAWLCVMLGAPLQGIFCILCAVLSTNCMIFDQLSKKDD
jgi:hypothetical protein